MVCCVIEQVPGLVGTGVIKIAPLFADVPHVASLSIQVQFLLGFRGGAAFIWEMTLTSWEVCIILRQLKAGENVCKYCTDMGLPLH
jgi:hypothetical protein